jgi:quercetin dioxygenase-like cupin family protein
MKVERIDLKSLGASLAIDCDYVLTESAVGAVVLIRLGPQDTPFPEEKHNSCENIICLDGRVALLAGPERIEVGLGECCRVPAGLAHRWASDSAGLVLVHFGS